MKLETFIKLACLAILILLCIELAKGLPPVLRIEPPPPPSLPDLEPLS